MWYSIVFCLAAILAASHVYGALPLAAASAVNGEMVDADVPATYRLPLVSRATTTVANDPLPLFLPPLPAIDQPAPFASQTQTLSTPSPAGSPPDERPVDENGSRDAIPVEVMQDGPQPVAPTGQAPSDVFSYKPTTTNLTSQLLPAVQRGFGLAQRGALYAARTEFVQVLRRVAQAQDAVANTDEHSRALAAGLRALDEAEDFVPKGIQLEAELDVRAVASSHRTRVLPDNPENVSPFEAVTLYHGFAQEQLAKAAAGEQAGSMALYGLGRIHARLAERSDDDVQLTRSAMTMYSAALAASPDNHLAANELGVLVCRTGRPAEAARLFEKTIDLAPSAVAYHNLGMAQRKLGMPEQAAANEHESQRLAAWERNRGDVSRRAGVQWVSPGEIARVAQPAPWTGATANRPVAQPPAKSPWQWTTELTKSLPRPGSGRANEGLGPMRDSRLARPLEPPAPNQLQWR